MAAAVETSVSLECWSFHGSKHSPQVKCKFFFIEISSEQPSSTDLVMVRFLNIIKKVG